MRVQWRRVSNVEAFDLRSFNRKGFYFDFLIIPSFALTPTLSVFILALLFLFTPIVVHFFIYLSFIYIPPFALLLLVLPLPLIIFTSFILSLSVPSFNSFTHHLFLFAFLPFSPLFLLKFLVLSRLSITLFYTNSSTFLYLHCLHRIIFPLLFPFLYLSHLTLFYVYSSFFHFPSLFLQFCPRLLTFPPAPIFPLSFSPLLPQNHPCPP